MTDTAPLPTRAVVLGELPAQLTIKGGLNPFTHERYEVRVEVDAPPFLRLEAVGLDLAFHVLDPFIVLEDYSPELCEDDARFLELEGPAETRLLSIVNLKNGTGKATVNLAAPIVVNTRTGVAKQVILHNASQFSVRHPLTA